ncbi:amino acid ABC transporter permease [uncultured Negativibacillus sp.]|uniref:amino acid ABC transporter permease n=1 Tax=uncultured Negativibacillus sp. TaxID=1980696 RepID=UPI0025CD239E|nr:amino acid ABC transporter permease [uncultured Negativibacillus sp.]
MKFNWEYFFQTLPYVASKLNITLSLTIISAIFSLIIGMVFALISYYKVVGLSQLLKVWVSFIRGTPVATQLFFFYYGLANLSSWILNMSPTVAVAVIMSLNMGAFVSETIRGSLISVDEGQREAAMSLGMSGWQMTSRIVIPQAIRVALPPLFNDLINLFKMSSLAFLVGVRDVMGAAKIEGANTFQFFECYACVMLIYWVITLILTAFQKVLEKRCDSIYA